ncbi:Uncharacterized protein APZ42_000316 [Daphnia magna]|uniref:Uncharacterized protein n=1 Tax=Daphnia magna TaxID=35525 RepID=A0A164JRI6_9CRUS|nr:Uncharacterized protein APZ42_000316 [Daphnia magna]
MTRMLCVYRRTTTTTACIFFFLKKEKKCDVNMKRVNTKKKQNKHFILLFCSERHLPQERRFVLRDFFLLSP